MLWPGYSLFKTLINSSATSFHTPRPNLPVTPGVSLLPTFAFQFSIMKRTSFGGISFRRSCRSYRTILLQLLQPINKNWIKDLLSMAPPIRTRPSFPLSQSLPSESFHKPLILIHQRADRMKTTVTEN